MPSFYRVVSILLTIIAFGTLQGCWWDRVTVLDTKLSYSELCSKERSHNQCSADGKYNVVFDESRPALPPYPSNLASDKAGKDMLVQEVLGKVWNTKNQQLNTCKDYKFSTSDYFDAFPGRKIDVSLLKTTEVKAKVEATVNATIQGKVDDAPKIAAALTAEITNAIQSNAFTLANYSVHDLKYDTLEILRNQKKCSELLSRPDNYLVTSVAVISSSGKFSESQQKDIQAKIEAELKNAKFKGNGVDGAVSAQLAMSVVMNTERDISTVTSSVNSVYSFGLWSPSLDQGDTTPSLANIADLKKLKTDLKNGVAVGLVNKYMQVQ